MPDTISANFVNLGPNERKVSSQSFSVIESLSRLDNDVHMLKLPSSFHSVVSSNASRTSRFAASVIFSDGSCPRRGTSSVRSSLDPVKVIGCGV